jgi:hypothetical protein
MTTDPDEDWYYETREDFHLDEDDDGDLAYDLWREEHE